MSSGFRQDAIALANRVKHSIDHEEQSLVIAALAMLIVTILEANEKPAPLEILLTTHLLRKLVDTFELAHES